jgi:hypothetical protein
MIEPLQLLNRLQRTAAITLGVGVLLCIVSLFSGVDRFMHSYLFAFCFWNGISLGCVGLLMLLYVIGGRWGTLLRRVFEAAGMTLPMMLLLFLPIAIFSQHLYTWATPQLEHITSRPHKAIYLTTQFFSIRSIIYFLIWTGLAILLRRWSLNEDNKTDSGLVKLQMLSGPGLIIYVLSASFASFDWTMSLEPDWYSSIYGMLTIVGQGLSALILGILAMHCLSKTVLIQRTVSASDFQDFGNMLLVFVLLSAYMSLSQFLIIWSGNLPEESVWYLRRSHGGWQWVAAFLAACHFLVPFLILLFRGAKRNSNRLSGVALLLAFSHLCECYWLVMPSFDTNALPHLSDIAAPMAVGGYWVLIFAYHLKRVPLLSADALALSPHTPAHTGEFR